MPTKDRPKQPSYGVWVADPDAAAHVLKPNADGSINVVGGGGGSSGGTATAASPTYSEGATGQPLSLDLHGAERILPMSPAGVAIDLSVGTAGTPAGGVSSVQGVAGMVPLSTTPFPITPVSGLTVAMTGTTSTAVTGIGAPSGVQHNYITELVVGNSHATVGTFVEIQDGSGGTTFFTVPAAAVYGGAALSFPTPLKQPTAATALFAKNTTTGANVIVSVSGFQA